MKEFSDISEFESRVQRHLAQGPSIAAGVFIAPTASVTGNVIIGARASIWFHTVLRGDIEPITIGEESNVQDGSVLHVADHLPCHIGKRCTIGHRAIVHACTIGDDCLIGMGAIILDGSEIGLNCIIGAGSLVTQNTKIPAGSMVFGSPAKVIRPLKDEEIKIIPQFSKRYVLLAGYHQKSTQAR